MSTVHSLGPAADLAAGESRRARVGTALLAVYNCDGSFYATDDQCSHEEASLADGWLEGTEVTCPLHGAIFDVTTGKPLCLPATKPVRTYPVRVEAGELLVEI